jgi:hypothetical protein
MNTNPIAMTLATSLVALSTGCASTTPGDVRCAASNARATSAGVGVTRAPVESAHRLLVTIRKSAGGEALASTSATLADGRDVELRTSNAMDHGEARLVVGVEHRGPDARGPYLVRVEWEESSADGRKLRWSPTVAMREGAQSSATVELGGGDGRRLDVTLDPEAPPGAEVATAAP